MVAGEYPEGLPTDSPIHTHRYPETNRFPGALKRFQMPCERTGGRLEMRMPAPPVEPPCTDLYARWRDRTAARLMGSPLPDLIWMEASLNAQVLFYQFCRIVLVNFDDCLFTHEAFA
jgi:hypothetical protein